MSLFIRSVEEMIELQPEIVISETLTDQTTPRVSHWSTATMTVPGPDATHTGSVILHLE